MASTASPLTQDARPSFQPKIVTLYESLFTDDGTSATKPETFWTSFFVLRAHPPALLSLLGPLSSDDLLHLQPITRQLFTHSVAAFRAGHAPQDEIALDTLQTLLKAVLAKRYTNASSDVISILTGLDEVDRVFTEFVAALEAGIRSGRTLEMRRKAVQVALGMASGAFSTGLVSYFTHRDLFPALMKFVNDPETAELTYEPFMLLGVLANYNKFEMQNPYQLRLDDFVNEAAMKRIVHEIGMTCIRCRADYVAIHDDLPEGWSLNSMLTYVGLTILAGAGQKPNTSAPGGDVSKLSFSTLPNSRAAILLPTYDFVHANKLFSHNFVNYQEKDPKGKKVEPPICAYISLTSYLLHHAHRSSRSSIYARTNLLVFRLLLEDSSLCKRLASPETQGFVRLCRQRPPHLPVVRGKRILLAAIIDTVADGLNHNLKKTLDIPLYSISIAVLHRAVSFLARSRTRLPYHWPELWRSILTLLRFLTSYATSLQGLPGLPALVADLVSFLVLALRAGDAFLPAAADADDLFYKLVEAGDVLPRLRDAYTGLASDPAMAVLVRVAEHYATLIEQRGGKNLSPGDVQEVIKTGYETLEIGEGGGVEVMGAGVAPYRESQERPFLKKVARVVVEDLGEDV
ncbi:hypothetical protein EDC01DRAFT_169640 [Geopyxis carbonaria]|nr:hypothetical protein EDC01DRAFT_448327 [Geopyxis carbonaria]KAI5788506.1 hypothetical protein EDC01DRAFT_169640 [Geopyxis carbonaria]